MLPVLRSRGYRAADPLELLNREMDRLMSWYGAEAETPMSFAPYAVDIHEDNDHFYVDADLPGFGKEDIDVTIENGVLTIRAQKKEEEKSKKGEPLHIERRWSQFQRSFTLPTAVKEEAVKAELANGILTVTLDKKEEVKPHKILVTAGDGRKKLVEQPENPKK